MDSFEGTVGRLASGGLDRFDCALCSGTPPLRTGKDARDFEARFRFRHKPTYVRFRCGRLTDTGFTELSVRADELSAPPPGITRVYIVENEITYLAFPLAPDAIVILGGG
jgi:hypothetical protein